jgi:gliding motility-associated-like protein
VNLEFIIYNRWGELVYKTTNWKTGWDGKIRGNLPPTGVYVWFLRYTERDTQRRKEMKGTVTLIR